MHVAVKQGIGGISSNPLDPQSEATNTITRATIWTTNRDKRTRASSVRITRSDPRLPSDYFSLIADPSNTINNLTKHYHLNANQTILRILLLSASNIELHQSFGFQSRDSSVYNVHSPQCKLSNF